LHQVDDPLPLGLVADAAGPDHDQTEAERALCARTARSTPDRAALPVFIAAIRAVTVSALNRIAQP
jgi:hypothetical protein